MKNIISKVLTIATLFGAVAGFAMPAHADTHNATIPWTRDGKAVNAYNESNRGSYPYYYGPQPGSAYYNGGYSPYYGSQPGSPYYNGGYSPYYGPQPGSPYYNQSYPNINPYTYPSQDNRYWSREQQRRYRNAQRGW